MGFLFKIIRIERSNLIIICPQHNNKHYNLLGNINFISFLFLFVQI